MFIPHKINRDNIQELGFRNAVQWPLISTVHKNSQFLSTQTGSFDYQTSKVLYYAIMIRAESGISGSRVPELKIGFGYPRTLHYG